MKGQDISSVIGNSNLRAFFIFYITFYVSVFEGTLLSGTLQLISKLCSCNYLLLVIDSSSSGRIIRLSLSLFLMDRLWFPCVQTFFLCALLALNIFNRLWSFYCQLFQTSPFGSLRLGKYYSIKLNDWTSPFDWCCRSNFQQLAQSCLCKG